MLDMPVCHLPHSPAGVPSSSTQLPANCSSPEGSSRHTSQASPLREPGGAAAATQATRLQLKQRRDTLPGSSVGLQHHSIRVKKTWKSPGGPWSAAAALGREQQLPSAETWLSFPFKQKLLTYWFLKLFFYVFRHSQQLMGVGSLILSWGSQGKFKSLG